ncbi:MAG: DUF5658 family protein [Planctomycetota bacterium]|nr:DUF5658 family protein [Planctomycetota bacterium]
MEPSFPSPAGEPLRAAIEPSFEGGEVRGHAFDPGSALVRRRRPDRRRNPTPRLSRYSLHGGRRQGVQRTEEREGAFVDLYSPWVLFWVTWVALMNIGDSFFTLVHLQAGGVEVNPVAAAMLRTGRFGFVFIKVVLIAAALLVLTLHKNFQLARWGLWVSTAAYTTLVIYHLTLF